MFGFPFFRKLVVRVGLEFYVFSVLLCGFFLCFILCLYCRCFFSQCSWNTAKDGVKQQSINQLYWDRPFTPKPLQIPILSVLYKSSFIRWFNLKINVCCIALFVFVWYTLCCQFLWIVHIGLSFRYPLLFIKQENEKGFCEPLVINTRILANIALYVANYNQITKIPYNSSVESYRKSFNVIE